ncbi:dynein heavy chain domain-containing protein 1-like [Genypterus blacodes]|uniref:dynein heavy chain domain-containing protein 1-like n=1 Tax=Genypterus blacodes TaxID=154954 RepID=UPI003F76F041
MSTIQPQSPLTAENTELLLRCAVLHSVLVQRQTYKHSGPQGRIYHWTQDDLQALVEAHTHIVSLCHDKTKALQYLAVNLVHGGGVTDCAGLEEVESVAQACLSTQSALWGSGPHMLSNLTCNTASFDLSGILPVLEQRVHKLGHISDPLLLGFSADVVARTIQIDSQNLKVLLSDSQTPPGQLCPIAALDRIAALPDYNHARDRLQALKSRLTGTKERSVKNTGAVSRGPLRDFLQTEWDDLRDSVCSLLSQLQQPTPRDRPAFTSLLKLTDLSGLERRAELLRAYLWGHSSTTDPPAAYRLSAFKNPKGFMVAMMREAAQLERRYVSDVSLHFQVLSVLASPASPPVHGLYLCGLILSGASWDSRLGALQDTLSPRPRSLPLLSVQAQVRNAYSAQDRPPRHPARAKKETEGAAASPCAEPQLPVYHCPLYADEGLNDADIITTVPLHAKLHPVLCTLRGVKLVSTL